MTNILVLLLILNISLVFTASIKYQISVSLLTPRGRDVLKISESTLEINNARTSSPLEYKVRSGSQTILKHNSDHACASCTYVLEFKAQGEKTFYTSIDAESIRNKAYEDYIEVMLSETNEIMSIKYGISQYLESDETPSSTIVREKYLKNAKESPHMLEDFEVSSSVAGEEPIKAEKEQSFFQKYFWYIIIGGFIVYQIMTVDKDKLNDAMNQAQNARQ